MNKLFFIFVAAFCLIAFMPTEAEAWYNSSWDKRVNLTLNSSAINGSHNEFVVFVNLSHMPTEFWSNVLANSSDLIVVGANDTTELPCREVRAFDKTNNKGSLFFKTTLTSSTYWYLYYNNSATSPKYNETCTWNSSYIAVYHFEESPTTTLRDSTANGFNGTPNNMEAGDLTEDQIRNAYNFDGVNEYVRNASSLGTTWTPTNLTIMMWINTTSASSSRLLFRNSDGVQQQYAMGVNVGAANKAELRLETNGGDASVVAQSTSNVNNGVPRFIVGAFASSIQGRLYVDGRNESTTTETGETIRTSTQPYFIASVDGTTANYTGRIDELRILNILLSPEWIDTEWKNQRNGATFYSIGAQESFGIGPTITIFRPENTTYFMFNNFNFTFNADDDNSTSYNLTAYITWPNGTKDATYTNASYLDNTNITFLRNLNKIGRYNLTVYGNDTGGIIGSGTVIFTIDDVEATESFTSYILETKSYNYTLFLRTNFDAIKNISTQFYWNGSLKPAFNFNRTNTTYITHVWNHTSPLLQTNATSVAHNFTYVIAYINNTVESPQYTTNDTQTVIFAYYFGSNAQTENTTNPIEGEHIGVNVTITNETNAATFVVNTSFNGTNTTATAINYSFYQITLTAPTISETNKTFNLNSTIFITFNGSTRQVVSDTDIITVHKLIITDCTTMSNVQVLTMFLKNEETDEAINGTIEITNNITKTGEPIRNYNFTYTNITNATMCINPAFANYSLTSHIQYYGQIRGTTYTVRNYFLAQTVSNQTTNLSLYLLSTALSDLTVFFVRDLNNNPVTDAYIQILRYVVGNNTYKTVAQCKSDNPDGKCTTYLRTGDTYYSYIVTKSDSVLLSTTIATIICQPFESISTCPPYPIRLQISSEAGAIFTQAVEGIQTSCSINQTSTVLRCTATDTSQVAQNYIFKVWKRGALDYTELCNTSNSGASVTFTCTLGTLTGNVFKYQMYAEFADGLVLLEQDTVDYSTKGAITSWGTKGLGLFIGFLIILTLFFAGISSPSTAIALSTVGIIVTSMLGMLPIPREAIVGIAIVAGLLMWKLRN